MVNYIWALMIICGIIFSTFTGNLEGITEMAIVSSKSAVTLAITMTGVMAMWTGLMRIAERSGLIAALTESMEGMLNLLFPKIPKNHAANKYIATNFIANILGLGWAATPAGLKAMEELQKLNKGKETASNEMCLFMVINMSSLQLISVNLLAYRMEYGSKNPAEVLGAGIFATAVNTVIAIILCKTLERLYREAPSHKKSLYKR